MSDKDDETPLNMLKTTLEHSSSSSSFNGQEYSNVERKSMTFRQDRPLVTSYSMSNGVSSIIGSSASTPRTSSTHPINISWILLVDDEKDQLVELLSDKSASACVNRDILDDAVLLHTHRLNPPHPPTGPSSEPLPSQDPLVTHEHLGREQVEEMEAGLISQDVLEEQGVLVCQHQDQPEGVHHEPLPTTVLSRSYHPPPGNLALTSCPGKKVRLSSGPINGKGSMLAVISRDLDSDFSRLASFGVTTLVNCLDDLELKYLGAPIQEYLAKAAKYQLQVIRIPITEGSCPNNVADIEPILQEMDTVLQRGENVVCHCRGGVGRAGLVACCYLIRSGMIQSPARAIQFVRMRRSINAIETARQEDFIASYYQYWNQL